MFFSEYWLREIIFFLKVKECYGDVEFGAAKAAHGTMARRDKLCLQR
jgi:hypothetical protein